MVRNVFGLIALTGFGQWNRGAQRHRLIYKTHRKDKHMITSEAAVAVYPTHVGAEQAVKELQELWVTMFLMFAALWMYVTSNGFVMITRW
jgi:hypothetical protein